RYQAQEEGSLTQTSHKFHTFEQARYRAETSKFDHESTTPGESLRCSTWKQIKASNLRVGHQEMGKSTNWKMEALPENLEGVA
ncbi:hypothetical protein HAX54_029168, partial [Datura stramonium]|nr:hypothetical protein [Datura stramonium]